MGGGSRNQRRVGREDQRSCQRRCATRVDAVDGESCCQSRCRIGDWCRIGLAALSPASHSNAARRDAKPRYGNDAGDASLATFADLAKEKVQDWSAQASEAVRQTGTQIADKTASVADRASATLHDAGDAARDTMTQIADKAASVAERASHRLRDTIPDQDDRDTYLLGAAALAVAAAVGIAYHRRAEEGTRPHGH